MFKVPKQEPPKEWKLENVNGGINLEDLEFKLADNQSPVLLNMWYKDRALSSRWGQDYFTTAQSGVCYAAFERKYKTNFIIHIGTVLYKVNSAGTMTSIFTGLPANRGSFFVFKNKTTGADILYYKNVGAYIQYDGTTVTNVIGYIPTVIMGRSHTGGGTTLEQYNNLSAGFINSFSPGGTLATFPLTLTNLDATAVTATLNGVAKVEGTDFTVNRTTGVVTFTVVPTAGTDTLKIAAYKTDAASLALIMNCKYAIAFGGANDTRVFMAGDSTTYYYSGLLDPTYMPSNQYNNAGVDDTYITGFGVQYNTLVVFKPRLVASIEYSVNADGSNPRFNYAPLNSNVGCDMPWTIQLINNKLVWCNTYAGVHMLISETQIKDEKDVVQISRNINGNSQRNGLLQETLTSASSTDFLGKYWLCVGSKVYMWDYTITPYVNTGNVEDDAKRLAWFPFDNIQANFFIQDNNNLYYGNNAGRMVVFNNGLDDFNLAINKIYRMPLRDFGVQNFLKTVTDLWITCRADTFTKIKLKYITEQNERTETQDIQLGSFSWSNSSFWSTFTWQIIKFAKTFRRRPNSKKVLFWAVELSNNEVGRDMSIMDITLWYNINKKIK